MPDAFDPYHKWLAIPPEEQPPDHYRLLGAKLFESDADVIDNAANQRMAHVRTFQTGKHSALSQKLLNEIAAARICLLKPDKKAQYDRALKAKLDAARPKVLKAEPLPAEAVGPAVDLAVLGDLAASYSTHTSTARKKPKRSFPIPALAGIAVAGLLMIVGIVYFLTHRNSPSLEQSRPVAAKPEKSAQPKSAPAVGTASTVQPSSLQPRSSDKPASSSTLPEPVEASSTIVSPKDDDRQEPSADDPPDSLVDGLALGAPTDLLKAIDPTRDAVLGRWTLRGKSLVAPAVEMSRLQIPVEPPAEYVLTLVVQRESGSDLGIGLTAGKSQVLVDMDGWGGTITALHTVDGRPGDKNETTQRERNVLDNRSAHTIVCIVQRDRLRVFCDQRKLIDFNGDSSRLGLVRNWVVPNKDRLFLGSYLSVIRFDKITLAPIESQPSSDFSAPSIASDESATNAPKDFTSKPNSAPDATPRAPVPDEAAAQEAVRLVRQVYAADLAKAKQLAEKSALAERLIEMADQADQDAEQYALLNEAQELALAANHPQLAARAVDGLAERFEVDALALAAEIAERTSKRGLTADAARELCGLVDEWVAQALRVNRFDVARRLVAAGNLAVRKAKLTDETKTYTRRAAELAQLQKQFAAFQEASDRVAANDDDAAAHLEIGKFLCFGMRRWDQGLPHLAAGSNADMRSAAVADLAKSMTADDQVKVADAWWDLADHEKAASTPLRERAGWWYRQALRDAAGLAKTRIEKRLSQVKLPEPAASSTASTGKSPKPKTRKKPDRWISQNATATPSSIAVDDGTKIKLDVKPALLTDSDDDHFGHFSFHTWMENGAHITIDLRKPMMVTRMMIRNRLEGYFDRAEGLTVWASNSTDETPQEVWRSTRVEREWTFELDNPVEARYIKVGLPPTKKNALHLSKIMVYGYDVPHKPQPAK